MTWTAISISYLILAAAAYLFVAACSKVSGRSDHP